MNDERPQTSVLARLTGHTAADFAERFWGRSPLLARRQERGGGDFGELFSLAAADELIADRGLRTPFVRMAKDGKTLPEKDFTAGGGAGAGIADQVDEDRVRRQLDSGATLVLQALHRTWPPVRRFVDDLVAELGHPVQVNCYLTPDRQQGFSHHYDVHDVFVLHLHGRKEWVVHEPVLQHPLRDQPWTDRADEVRARGIEEPLLRVVLEPGDCLYLPRGFVHAARATGGLAAHLTVGVHNWTPQALATELVDAATARLREDPELRRSLAPGVAVGEAAGIEAELELVRRRLLETLAEVSAEEVAEVLGRRAARTQRPAAVAPFATLSAAESLAPANRLRLRPGLMLRLESAGDGDWRAESRAGQCVLPDSVARALRRLEQGPATVEELYGVSGADLNGLRMLVRHGLAQIGEDR
ncbi:cupin [Enemella dayhoffiae]|uniref:Cupin n=1 Tax=Enemella dayhoffiae TaxID=2016507 RepID=A0A255HAA8_9ACTN|nr:cupin domain-containing protein [Enemella dayhoffiae]OYO23514.1 cupin [Enemella dayhoffiae]